jgi:hypothetical protein
MIEVSFIQKNESVRVDEDIRAIDFQEFFIKSVIEGTTRVVGESAAMAVLFHAKFMENSRNPRLVHSGFESMLMHPGSNLVEKSIVIVMFANLKEKIPESLNLSNDEFDFCESVSLAHNIFDARLSNI